MLLIVGYNQFKIVYDNEVENNDTLHINSDISSLLIELVDILINAKYHINTTSICISTPEKKFPTPSNTPKYPIIKQSSTEQQFFENFTNIDFILAICIISLEVMSLITYGFIFYFVQYIRDMDNNMDIMDNIGIQYPHPKRIVSFGASATITFPLRKLQQNPDQLNEVVTVKT